MVSTLFTVWPTGTETAATSPNEAAMAENVDEQVVNMFPLAAPLHQVLGQLPVSNTSYQALVDTFSDVTRTKTVITNNENAGPFLAQDEGSVPTADNAQYVAKLTSVMEIQHKLIKVSNTARAVRLHGVSDEFDYQALKRTQSVLNNMEWSMWWSRGTLPGGEDVDGPGGGNVAVRRQTQGLMYWILKSGLERARTGTTPGNCTTATTSANTKDGNGNDFATDSVGGASMCAGAGTWAFNANGTPLDAAMFKTNLLEPWFRLTNQQGDSTGFASPRMKTLFSSFATNVNGLVNTRNIDAMDATVVDTIDYYRTEFGLVSMNLCQYLSQSGVSFTVKDFTGASVTVQNDETIVLIKPKYFKIGVLRPIHFVPMGVTGDFEQGYVVGEKGLVCKNPQAGVAIVNAIP